MIVQRGVIQMKINYKQVGDVQLPDLQMEKITLTEMYMKARMKYLEEDKPDLYFKLLTQNQMNNHLKEIQQEAEELEELLMNQMLESEKNLIPDKATAQMEWVGYMNNLKNRVQEMVLAQVVYN